MKRFMTTKMAMSILVIAVALAMVGMGTFAIFSDSETSTGNTFAAGSLDIETGTATWTTDPGQMNMYPGDSQEFTLQLNNVGSLPLNWTATASIDNETCFDVSVVTPSSGTLAVSGSTTVSATVSMDSSIGNSCMLATGSLTIDVNATQV